MAVSRKMLNDYGWLTVVVSHFFRNLKKVQPDFFASPASLHYFLVNTAPCSIIFKPSHL